MVSFPTMFKKLNEATFNDLTPFTTAYLATGLDLKKISLKLKVYFLIKIKYPSTTLGLTIDSFSS